MNNFRRRVENSSGSVLDPVTGRGIVDGYEVVDLGLPNGLLFATCNVGADSETDYGDYYKYGMGSTKYTDNNNGYSGTESTLYSSADTATQVMGSGWRMPTQTELDILGGYTDHTWVTDFNGSGINGCKFTSKTNPNAYVFFPAAGRYYDSKRYYKGNRGFVWSSTSPDTNLHNAIWLYFDSTTIKMQRIERSYGCSVRGVHAAV